LIYAFLKKQAQTKAADAVKKAARNLIVLKDDFQLEGPHLDEIVQQWKQSQATNSSWVFIFPDVFNSLNKKHEFIVLNLTVCVYYLY